VHRGCHDVLPRRGTTATAEAAVRLVHRHGRWRSPALAGRPPPAAECGEGTGISLGLDFDNLLSFYVQDGTETRSAWIPTESRRSVFARLSPFCRPHRIHWEGPLMVEWASTRSWAFEPSGCGRRAAPRTRSFARIWSCRHSPAARPSKTIRIHAILGGLQTQSGGRVGTVTSERASGRCVPLPRSPSFEDGLPLRRLSSAKTAPPRPTSGHLRG
jgi:hypothetical protein